jgi:Na+/glutamate symporter
MNKFLLFLLIATCFLVTLFLFGRKDGESRRDYLLFWLKSSLFTSVIFFILVMANEPEIFFGLNLKAYLSEYFICLFFAFLFMGGATFFLYSRKIKQ